MVHRMRPRLEPPQLHLTRVSRKTELGYKSETLRAAACKDREFAVNEQILRIALILPKNPHW